MVCRRRCPGPGAATAAPDREILRVQQPARHAGGGEQLRRAGYFLVARYFAMSASSSLPSAWS